MAVIRLQEVVVDCRDPRALVGFWAAVLRAVPVVRTDDWAYLDSHLLGTRLAFQRVPEIKSTKNRVHLDLEVDDIADERDRVTALGAFALGELVVDEQGPFQVMVDPEGNEFCLVS
jgi:catechol 2,3-dioxygenase-like lactoylglutathione lyase family enzyme